MIWKQYFHQFLDAGGTAHYRCRRRRNAWKGRSQDAPPLFPRDQRGAATKENITGIVKLYSSSCPQSPFKLKTERPSPRAAAPIAVDGSFEFRNVPPGKYALCVAIGGAPYVVGPSVTITNKDAVNIVLPRMRGGDTKTTGAPSLAGSGPLTLDWPRIEQAAKAERENAGSVKRAQK